MVLAILETVVPTPKIIDICTALTASGYVLALDDFVESAKWAPLISLAKYIKVDFRATGSAERRSIAVRYRLRGIQLVAEKVETQAELNEARSFGYAYFQGYFFCKPSMVSARDIPASKITCLRLLQASAAQDFSHDAIEELLKNDPGLVYKLLRYLNSPILGLRGEIHGVREAIAMLGEKEFRRWVAVVAVVTMASDKPDELVRTALTRGIFCEDIASVAGMEAQSAELFLLGLLSIVDALLDRPIEQVLSNLPVSPELRTALSGGANRLRDVYDMLIAYERADWDALSAAATRVGPVEASVPDCYRSAASRSASLLG